MALLAGSRAGWRALAWLGAVLLATSCATGSPAGTPAPSPAGGALSGWIALPAGGVRFVQWVQDGAALTGTFSWVLTATDDPTKLLQGRSSFTGTSSGGSVIVTFSGGADGSQSWAGTISSGQLTLSFTTADGSMEVDAYQPGTVADYNASVARVRSAVQQALDASASAAAAGAAASAAAQQQTEAAFSQRCASLGGTTKDNPIWGLVCTVDFPDAQDQPVPLNADGSLDAAKAEINHGNCLSHIQDAQTGAQDGHTWQYPPVWHPEMGVCDPGEP
jgi:hypothetical protein